MQFPPIAPAALAVLCGLLVGCGAESDTVSGSTTTSDTVLVAERRPITPADEQRIQSEPSTTALDCTDRGGSVWDYDAVGPDEPRGRTADDALHDAIEDLNQDAVRQGSDEYVPRTGWIELINGPSASTFVHGVTEWRFLVDVGGDADLGVWRHFEARFCLP